MANLNHDALWGMDWRIWMRSLQTCCEDMGCESIPDPHTASYIFISNTCNFLWPCFCWGFKLPWDQNKSPKLHRLWNALDHQSVAIRHGRRWFTLPFRSSCRPWSWRKNLLAEGQSGWSLTKWLHGRHQSLSRTSVATLGDPLWCGWCMLMC